MKIRNVLVKIKSLSGSFLFTYLFILCSPHTFYIHKKRNPYLLNASQNTSENVYQYDLRRIQAFQMKGNVCTRDSAVI